MLLFLVFVVLGYFAYRYFGWIGVGGDAVAYIAVAVLMANARARSRRAAADRIVGTKLSDDEKRQFTASAEHHAAMDAHRAQFDPEFRRSREQ